MRRGRANYQISEAAAKPSFLLLTAKWPKHPFHETMQRIMEWGEAVGSLVAAVIAHHGRPVEPPSAPTLREWRSLPHYDWRAEAPIMDEALHRWFTGAFEPGEAPLPVNPRFGHEVAAWQRFLPPEDLQTSVTGFSGSGRGSLRGSMTPPKSGARGSAFHRRGNGCNTFGVGRSLSRLSIWHTRTCVN